jgi:hypothetical protein
MNGLIKLNSEILAFSQATLLEPKGYNMSQNDLKQDCDMLNRDLRNFLPDVLLDKEHR